MKFRNLVTSAVLLFITIVLMEIALRAFTPFPIHSPKANRIHDDKLVYRISPDMGDIDENGFRNPGTFETVDMVTIGDSHTFGFNVSSENSWPRQLATMSNMTVYNFGVAGYGSLQYHYLIDEAIKLKPKHIILGLFPANDLYDACKLIDTLPYWNQWAREHHYDTDACVGSRKSGTQVGTSGPLEFLVENTATGSLVAYVWKLASERLNLGIEGEAVFISHESSPTIITHKRIDNHNRYMDLERNAISLGLDIFETFIKDAKVKSDLNDIVLSILIIPSKERVYYGYLTQQGYQLPDNYHQLVDNENGLIDRFSLMFDELGINYVDAMPYVLRELDSTKHVYPNTGDGHPLAPGYKAYVEAVYETLFD